MEIHHPYALKGNVLYSQEDRSLSVFPDSYIVVDGAKTAGVFASLPEEYRGIPVTNWGDRLIIPGLCDLHLHAPQYPFRGLGMDLELLEWLDAYAYPEEARYEDLEYADSAYTIFAGALRRSATTRACLFATLHVPATEILMEKLEAVGVAAWVGKVQMDRNCPDNLREDNAAQSLTDTRRWIEDTAGRFQFVRPMLSPRFIPACSDALLSGLGEIQRETGLPVQSHLSETQAESDWVRSLCPDAPFYGAAYDKHGLFGGGYPAVMAHCVYSGDEEIELIRRRGVFIAHCPQSNANLSSGIAPLRRFLDEGLNVGLGTDIAGGHSLNMFRAMADAIEMSKLRRRLTDSSSLPVTAADVFYLATRGGGALFGKAGAFEPGYLFDALVLDDASLPHPQPLTCAQRLERLIYLAGERQIAAKYVEGRRLW